MPEVLGERDPGRVVEYREEIHRRRSPVEWPLHPRELPGRTDIDKAKEHHRRCAPRQRPHDQVFEPLLASLFFGGGPADLVNEEYNEPQVSVMRENRAERLEQGPETLECKTLERESHGSPRTLLRPACVMQISSGSARRDGRRRPRCGTSHPRISTLSYPEG